MKTSRKLAVLVSLLLVAGCRKQAFVAPETPMPANTVLLSQVMREISAEPGAQEKLLKELGSSELVRAASEEQLAAVVGRAAARKVRAHYQTQVL